MEALIAHRAAPTAHTIMQKETSVTQTMVCLGAVDHGDAVHRMSVLGVEALTAHPAAQAAHTIMQVETSVAETMAQLVGVAHVDAGHRISVLEAEALIAHLAAPTAHTIMQEETLEPQTMAVAVQVDAELQILEALGLAASTAHQETPTAVIITMRELDQAVAILLPPDGEVALATTATLDTIRNMAMVLVFHKLNKRFFFINFFHFYFINLLGGSRDDLEGRLSYDWAMVYDELPIEIALF